MNIFDVEVNRGDCKILTMPRPRLWQVRLREVELPRRGRSFPQEHRDPCVDSRKLEKFYSNLEMDFPPEIHELILLNLPFPKLLGVCPDNSTYWEICNPSNNWFWQKKAEVDFGITKQQWDSGTIFDIDDNVFNEKRQIKIVPERFTPVPSTGRVRYLQLYAWLALTLMINAINQNESDENVAIYFLPELDLYIHPVLAWALYLERHSLYFLLLSKVKYMDESGASTALEFVLEDGDLPKLQRLISHPPYDQVRHTFIDSRILTPITYDIIRNASSSQFYFIHTTLSHLLSSSTQTDNVITLLKYIIEKEQIPIYDFRNMFPENVIDRTRMEQLIPRLYL